MTNPTHPAIRSVTHSFRPATNEEILAKYEGKTQTFEGYACDTPRGVKTKWRSRVRSVGGVPMVMRRGRLETLRGQMMTIDGNEMKWPCELTIRS